MDVKRTIRNCKDSFAFVCPREWDQLEKTERESVRFCSSCRKEVYFCSTDEQTIQAAKEGRCIAREIPALRLSDRREFVVGNPKLPEEVDRRTPEQIAAEDQYYREQRIEIALKEASAASRSCPQCNYPVPDEKKYCIVCHYKVWRVPRRG